ncbi:hypothetical protein NDU88_004861, partial [Pleurodeles waltl]
CTDHQCRGQRHHQHARCGSSQRGEPAAARMGAAAPGGHCHQARQEIAAWLRQQRLEGIRNEYWQLVTLEEEEEETEAALMIASPSSSSLPEAPATPSQSTRPCSTTAAPPPHTRPRTAYPTATSYNTL